MQCLSHRATNEAFNHYADYLNINLELKWSPEINVSERIKIWCAPGAYKSLTGIYTVSPYA